VLLDALRFAQVGTKRGTKRFYRNAPGARGVAQTSESRLPASSSLASCLLVLPRSGDMERGSPVE